MLEELKLNEVKVEKVIRLGKRLPPDADSDKPRPLKVVVDNEDNKLHVIRYAKKLEKCRGWKLGKSLYIRISLRNREKQGTYYM